LFVILKRKEFQKMEKVNQKKLELLNNPFVIQRVEEAIILCQPEKVTVITDSPEDIQYVREIALKNKEEEKQNNTGIPGICN